MFRTSANSVSRAPSLADRRCEGEGPCLAAGGAGGGSASTVGSEGGESASTVGSEEDEGRRRTGVDAGTVATTV